MTRRRVLPATPSSASLGRRLVRDLLAEAGRDDLADTAELVASELITNALLHAATPVEVSASAGPDGVRLEVGDGSDQLPVERDYSALAGTGRGLGLVHQVAKAWGVRRTPTGKVVWADVVAADDPVLLLDDELLAELADLDIGPGSADAEWTAAASSVDVVLQDVPLLMHSAWHEYAEALLRDYALAQLDFDTFDDAEAGGLGSTVLAVHARAGQAMALLHAQLPMPELPVVPIDLDGHLDADAVEALYADALEPAVTLAEAVLRVPSGSVDSFRALELVMEAALTMADNGELLAAAPPPELRELRRWFCREVDAQVRGGVPTPWRTPEHAEGPWAATRAETDLDRSSAAIVAADENNRIVSVSKPALDLLGHRRPEELVGQRLLDIIPARFHQAHLAGFTLHLAVGRRPLVARSVTVPFLCKDGSERLLRMRLEVVAVADGERLFVATLGDEHSPAT